MAIPQQYAANRPYQSGSNNNGGGGGMRRGPQQYNNNNGGNRGGRGGNQYQQGPRRNERIRASEVRVIDPDGQQVGLMSSASALQRARDFGLDLVEIAPNANPPVCRIVDYGKYQYEESKRQKKQKTATTKMKEVKMRPRCDAHDFMIKIRRAEGFLFQGHKIKLTLSFRFRELEHPEVGYELIKQAIAKLAHIGTPDHPARLAGRSMNTTLTPVSQGKRKLLYSTTAQLADVEEDEEDDDEDGEEEVDAADTQETAEDRA